MFRASDAEIILPMILRIRIVILEGIVTTLNEDKSVRVSAMGPIVEADFRRLVFRPFTTSRTFVNLKRSGQGIFHVTDDVELIARAAIDQLEVLPPGQLAVTLEGYILADACRWYAFRVDSMDEEQARAVVPCRVVERGFQREFFGLNRAKHAVVEAAILATRVQFMDARQLRDQFLSLTPLVEKTGGPVERRAFALLQRYVLQASAETEDDVGQP